jgi:hypothetical protein
VIFQLAPRRVKRFPGGKAATTEFAGNLLDELLSFDESFFFLKCYLSLVSGIHM